MMTEGHLFSYQLRFVSYLIKSVRILNFTLNTEEMKLAACWNKVNGLSRKEICSRNALNNLSL